MSRHVDAEMLGRFRAGDLSRSRAARIAAHLRGCGRCAELSRQLAGVTELLASVPVPPMPEHLASRISSSLAMEAARRAERDAAAGADRADRADREHRAAGAARARRRPWRGFAAPVAVRALAAAAAVVVLAGGGYAILHGTASPTSGPSSSGAASGRKSVPSYARPAGLPSSGMSFGPALDYRTSAGPASFRPVASADNYRPGHLTAQVASTLVRFGQLHAAEEPATRTIQTATPGTSPAATGSFGGVPVGVIEGCVNRVAAGHRVLLVDLARYRGERATVIVISGPAPASDHLWVVGPGCSALSSDVLAQADLPG
jgi:hypothetical protein